MGGGDVGDMLSGLDHLVAEGLADPDRIGIMGVSYGGFMSCWLPTQDARFKAAVAISPVPTGTRERFGSNLGAWVGDFLDGQPKPAGGQYYDRSPVLFAHADRTPTLLTAGLQDRATPPDQAIEFHNALVEHGVPADVVIYPEEGHGVHTFPAHDRHHDARRGVVPASHARTRLTICDTNICSLCCRHGAPGQHAALVARRHRSAGLAARRRTSIRRASCARSSTCTSGALDHQRGARGVAHAVPLHDQPVPRL